MMTTITVITMPTTSMFFAVCGFLSFQTKYAITPPSQPSSIGRSHHQPGTGCGPIIIGGPYIGCGP